MKFFRLTSVFFCCALLSLLMVVSASAADDDNYYSLAPVSSASEPSLAIEWPVNPVAEYDSILASISRQLGSISSQITVVQKNQATIADILSGISGILTNNGKSLGRIETSLSSSETILTTISGKVASESTLSSFEGLFSSFAPCNSEFSGSPVSVGNYLSKLFSLSTNNSLANDGSNAGFNAIFNKGFAYNVWVNPVDDSITPVVGRQFSWSGFVSTLLGNFIYDGINSSGAGGGPTIYRMLHLLQDTLASEDDRQLAVNYKDNRQQAETNFLSGKSGKTSLGKDDFGSLSSVGGTFHDISSLNGQASLDSFSSGLTDADTAGQGWFSQSTKDSLDTVSGSTSSESSVSTFSDDGLYSVDVDSDPYNMGDFTDNYSWLWGDNDD